jgi:hypothetical protein
LKAMTNVAMTHDLLQWPNKLSHEQRKVVKERNKAFEKALKLQARPAGWRYAAGSIFCQQGDWFVSNLPTLGWEHGATIRLRVKPMALDPLFWDITGLSENNSLPLSIRANGAWVLQPTWHEAVAATGEANVNEIAEKVLRWSSGYVQDNRREWSVDAMLKALGNTDQLIGHRRTMAICLHLLRTDLDSAAALCSTNDSELDIFSRESGGFVTGSVNFIDQARDWIAAKRRSTSTL